jgi:hypothetical protein
VYSVNLNYNKPNYNTINACHVNCKNTATNPSHSGCGSYRSEDVSFGSNTQAPSQVRTTLSGKTEVDRYNKVVSIADKDTRKVLADMLKSGVLLDANSNDKSTVLDNLYKIVTTERAKGLNPQELVRDTVTSISNPYTITQQFGDIPKKYENIAVGSYLNGQKADANSVKSAQDEINVDHSGTCVAASIEFNLAKKHPAEFARFAEGLSSKNMSVNKQIHLKNLTDKSLDAVWLLDAFEIPHDMKNFETADLKIAPDKDAIVRAVIQTTDRDDKERSPIDVLMQSAFMNVGSEQSYNSLSDKRKGKFNQNDKGLIEFEKTFTESVVEDKNKLSVTYQTVDDNSKLIGYETDFNTIKKQITDAINMGENVIIGYTQVDNNNVIVNGHEITITDVKKDKNGKLIFVCNDTDDGVSKPIEYSEDYLLPKIHHAALPQAVVKDDVNITENWVEGLNSYKQMKKQAA